MDSPYSFREARNDTWEIRYYMELVMDGIPTELAAENICREFNRAYHKGYRAAQASILNALGAR